MCIATEWTTYALGAAHGIIHIVYVHIIAVRNWPLVFSVRYFTVLECSRLYTQVHDLTIFLWCIHRCDQHHATTKSSKMHKTSQMRNVTCVRRLVRIVSPLLWWDLSASHCWNRTDRNILSVRVGVPGRLWWTPERALTTLGNIAPIAVNTQVTIK